MFCHPHLMDSFFGNVRVLQDSMRLLSAFAVEQELQESRREQIEKSGDNIPELSGVKSLSISVLALYVLRAGGAGHRFSFETQQEGRSKG